MVVILQTIFSDTSPRIQMYEVPKFVPKGPNNNIPALVQIMAWRRPGDKPLSEPMIFSFLTHICITRLQRVKTDHVMHSCINKLLHKTWYSLISTFFMVIFMAMYDCHYSTHLFAKYLLIQCFLQIGTDNRRHIVHPFQNLRNKPYIENNIFNKA